MLVEFTQFLSYRGFGGYMNEGDYIQIEEERYDEQTHVITGKFILNAIPLARATLKEPNKLFLFINNYVPLWRIAPGRLRSDGGWIFVLKLTPDQYEVLQAALQRGSKLDFVKMRKDEAEHYLKYHTLPRLKD